MRNELLDDIQLARNRKTTKPHAVTRENAHLATAKIQSAMAERATQSGNHDLARTLNQQALNWCNKSGKATDKELTIARQWHDEHGGILATTSTPPPQRTKQMHDDQHDQHDGHAEQHMPEQKYEAEYERLSDSAKRKISKRDFVIKRSMGLCNAYGESTTPRPKAQPTQDTNRKPVNGYADAAYRKSCAQAGVEPQPLGQGITPH